MGGGAVTASCPKCGCSELHTHRARSRVDFVPRWIWFGRLVPRTRPLALEVSCAECFFSFTQWQGRWTADPFQAVHEQMKAAQSQWTPTVVKGNRDASPDGDKPVARPLAPRPAPDPRVKPRR